MHNSDTVQGRVIYCDVAGSVSVLVVRVTAGIQVIEAVAGAGEDKPGWYTAGNGNGNGSGDGGGG